eukprot:PITA_04243
MVEWRGIPTETFDGFSVLVSGDQTMVCAHYVPELSVMMGTYTLTDHFFVINILDTNMVLGVQWLITLGKVTKYWKALEMEWDNEKTGRHEKIRGQHTYLPQTVSAHRMEAVFRKGDVEWMVELRASEVGTTRQMVHPEIQPILDQYATMFGEIPLVQPPDRGFEHTIELERGIQAVITTLYRHPKAYWDEIERAIQELLALGHIRLSTSPFAFSVVLVKKKNGTLRMCIDYKALNKKTLKNRYPIPRIDELMDELKGARFFSKIDLRSRYHQIHVREQDIAKTAFSQLRKFVLVLFDDILIYSKTWEEHLQHIETVLRILEEQQFNAKLSKCEFGLTEMLYLGHMIGVDGVRVYEEKIRAIRDWPEPRNVTELRGFIGICTYYRKFVKSFSQLAAPLTDLTRKGAFSWSDTAQRAFDRLKEVMSSCLVLALPDFTQPFVLECDASGEGIDTVLMQGGRPIAFESQKLLPHERLYSIYDKEMLAIMHALAKFGQYLVGNRFKVRADHNSLRFFLEQKQLHERQLKWISKIQAYDYDIEYVKGGDDRYKVVDEIIYYRDRIFLTEGSQLKKKILQASHDSPFADHQGFTKTYRAIRERFSWKGLKEDVLQHVRECDVCQRNKGEMSYPAGLLQPLPIPEGKWECISMDFITGLPMVQGKDCIFVDVDRLTKYAHFFTRSVDYTTVQVAELFFREFFRLHGLPKTITSDRDIRFMGGFWQELFRLVGTELTPSTSYQPQTDGQTEIVNKWLEGYLRNYVSG